MPVPPSARRRDDCSGRSSDSRRATEGRSRETLTPSDLVKVLRAQGFDDPERWLGYAQGHGFRPTRSERLTACPECGVESSHPVGQYVYYSTLARLRQCTRCGLVYSDVRLDPAVIRAHFERAYKDEQYFAKQRRGVFEQLARVVDHYAPPGGSVLDVGGAKGHLLDAVRRRRADLRLALTDVSETACGWARQVYGLRAICGSITTLERLGERFDVVVLSDVLYYEPDAPALWRVLPKLVADDGAVVIRVPNSFATIRAAQLALRLISTRNAWAQRDRIAFFNPEHLFVFSRGFLARKLKSLGFHTVVTHPAELLIPNGKRGLARLLWLWCARATYALTFRQVILTPSLLVSARRRS